MAARKDSAKSRESKARDRKLDDAVDMTFPASDPVAPGHSTGTEPPRGPADRKAPVVSREEIERAARKRG